jgi:hypothetical protein
LLDDAELSGGFATVVRTGLGLPVTEPSAGSGGAGPVRTASGTTLLSPAISEGTVVVWHTVSGSVLAASVTSQGVVRVLAGAALFNGGEVTLYYGDQEVIGVYYFDP